MATVSPTVRLELRRLKDNFDFAFSRLRKDDGPDDEMYRVAREAYGLWRIAIDKFGIPLLDSLDAAEGAANASDQNSAKPKQSPVELLTDEQASELRVAFQTIDQMSEMIRLIDDDDLISGR